GKRKAVIDAHVEKRGIYRHLLNDSQCRRYTWDRSDGVQSQASDHFSQIVADDEVVLDDQDAWGRSAHSPGPLTTLLHTPRQSSKCARPLLSSGRLQPREENRPTRSAPAVPPSAANPVRERSHVRKP